MAASLTNKILIIIATISAIIEMAAAANYTVGGPNGGWDLRTSLSTWASTISFKTGDNLLFKYDKSNHDVVEVIKSNYDSCNATGPIKTYSSGDDVIPLGKPGSRYFICGVPTHCSLGMKLQIDATSSSSPPPSGSPPSKPSAPAGSPPPESGRPGGPTPLSTAGGRSLEGKVQSAGLIAVGVMMLLAL